MPRQEELKLTPGAAYVHMTSNNTIEGTEYKDLPAVGDVPLVSDTSSDMFSRPIDITRHALIYSGAQKNMGPAGVTVVIVRDDMLQRSNKAMPTMLNYAVHAENGSMYNTPPAFAVYALGLVMKWLIGTGGLAAIATANERKAAKLLGFGERVDQRRQITRSHGYRCPGPNGRASIARGGAGNACASPGPVRCGGFPPSRGRARCRAGRDCGDA